MTPRLLPLLLLLLLAPVLRAQDRAEPQLQREASSTCTLAGTPSLCVVRLSLDNASPSVADRLVLTLEAEAPDAVRIQWPVIPERLADLDVLARDEQTIPAADARRTERRTFVLEPFLPGDRTLPRLPVRFVGADSTSCEVAIDAVSFTVRSLLPEDAAEIPAPELRPLVEPPPLPTPWWVWAAGGAGAIVIASAVTALALRLRSRPTPVHLSPYAQAMARLKHLESLGTSPADPRAYAADLGETLRAYIPAALDLPPRDRTTPELLDELATMPTINAAAVTSLLNRLDEIAFGAASPDAGGPELLDLRERSYKLVMGLQAARAAADADKQGGPDGV